MSEGVKHDSGKLRYWLMDRAAMAWTTAVLTYGAELYAPENWRKVNDGDERYYSALIRHVEAWRAGERFDPDTGLPHLAHAACCCVFLLGVNEPDTSALSQMLGKALVRARELKAARQSGLAQGAVETPT